MAITTTPAPLRERASAPVLGCKGLEEEAEGAQTVRPKRHAKTTTVLVVAAVANELHGLMLCHFFIAPFFGPGCTEK